MTTALTIALSKGRIFQETLPLLAAAGINPVDDPETSRKLILDTNQPDIKLVIIRATDTPTYVQYGAADLGVAGKDVLLEHGGEGLYEPLDLRIACCRLMVAGDPNHRPRRSLHASPLNTPIRPAVGSLTKAGRWRSSSCTVQWSWPRWSDWRIVLTWWIPATP